MFSISASRPWRVPAPITRRRSSLEKSSARISAIASQSRAAKHAGSARRLGLPCFPAAVPAGELFESRDRGVQIGLVEYLGAVDHVAFNRENGDPAPLGVETLLRGLMRCAGDDCSEVVQTMHSLDIDIDVVGRDPAPRGGMRIRSPGPNAVSRRWSTLTQSGVVDGSSCRLSAV